LRTDGRNAQASHALAIYGDVLVNEPHFVQTSHQPLDIPMPVERRCDVLFCGSTLQQGGGGKKSTQTAFFFAFLCFMRRVFEHLRFFSEMYFYPTTTLPKVAQPGQILKFQGN